MKVYLIEEGIVFGPKSFMSWDIFSIVLAELNGTIKGIDRARRNAITFNQEQLSSELNANALTELADLIGVKSENRTANQLCSDIKKKLKRIATDLQRETKNTHLKGQITSFMEINKDRMD